MKYVLDVGFGFFLEVDYSKWDSTLGSEALEMERRLLNMAGVSGRAKVFLDGQSDTLGVTKQGVRYHVLNTRKSGVPNTSIGNSLLNALVTASFMESRGVDYRLIVLGDDMLCALKAPISLQQYDTHCRCLGLIPEILWHDHHYAASFCSAYFWCADVLQEDGTYENSFVLGVKPHRLLSKFGYKIDFGAPFPKRQIFNEIRGLLPVACVIPFVREMLREETGDRVLGKYKVHGFAWEPVAPSLTGKFDDFEELMRPNDETYAQCEAIYGFSDYTGRDDTLCRCLEAVGASL
jgi:hypothetical protein